MSGRYRIAVYLRLSKEDEGVTDESSSIINQRMMLGEYVRKNFTCYELKEYSDDGYSGTNFVRPGVTEMLEGVRNGRTDCVIVKDFSRFSRDYIELGAYLEQIFPFLGVRFISVNDNYDSEKYLGNTAGLNTSFQGLLYDLYSKDLSVKVKSALRIRKEQGQYVSAIAPFGYRKDPADRHRLIIAEDEADVVRRIYAMALLGNTSTEITRLLNQEKVPTPAAFKMRKKNSQAASPDRLQWNNAVVCSILKNPVYAGDMVYGKYEKDRAGGKSHLKPRNEWKLASGHHAAVIPREDFEKIQKKQDDGHKRKNTEHHPLQGKVFCGGCKKSMLLRKSSRSPCFYCKQRYVCADDHLCVRSISLMFLEQAVLYRINTEQSVQDSLRKTEQKKETGIQNEINALEKDRNILLRKKAALQRERLQNYERAVFEADRESWITAGGKIQALTDEICCEISRLEEEISRRKKEAAVNISGEWRMKLSAELAEALIRKITVYGGQHIEIEWRSDIR